MIRKIKEWVRNHNTWLWLLGYIVIAMGLIILLPSSYFPPIYHLPKIITYLLVLIAPILALSISYLVMLLSYIIMGLSYLMLLIPYGLMALVKGLFVGIIFLIASVAEGVEHLFHKRVDSNVAILIPIGFIGVIMIFISIATILFQLL